MAFAEPNRAGFTRAAPVAGSASDPIGRLMAAFGGWRARNRALAELQALDDATLADLGWSRGELPAMARRGAR